MHFQIMNLLKIRNGYNMLIGNMENEINWFKKIFKYERNITTKPLCQILLKYRQLNNDSYTTIEKCVNEYNKSAFSFSFYYILNLQTFGYLVSFRSLFLDFNEF